MNHNPSSNSANVHSSNQAVIDRASDLLNPTLQQALGCLDVKLEDELARFRDKQAHLAAVMTAQAVAWEPQAADDQTDPQILNAEIIESLPIPTDQEPAREMHAGGFIIINGLPTPKANLTAITRIDYVPLATHADEIIDVPNRLDLNFSSGGEITPFHNEYLASSQELLRQIQSGSPIPADPVETSTQPAPIPSKRKLLTPVKIGSIAAVCVLAGGGVYTALNPQILAPLTTTKIVSPATTASSLGQIIQSPNLAANEFTELNLSTIVTAKIPTPAATTTTTTLGTTATPITTSTATTPVAIPFNRPSSSTIPIVSTIAQPQLADSLVKSLLPPNFHVLTRRTPNSVIQPRIRR